MKKRLLAWLLSLSITAGMLPVYAVAADPQPQSPEAGDSGMQVEESTVEVEYTTANRSKATITYHKKGVAANPFNLLFLVDTSRQGKLSHQSFELMLRDSGMGYIYDYQAASNVQLIGYQQDIMRNTGIVSSKSDLTKNFGNHGTPGEGTANELVALDEAINAVKTLKEKHGENSTVVFWVLGEEFGVQDNNAIEAKLKELTSLLDDETDALITWQLAGQPNALLTQYATKYSEAHSDPNDKQSAAHAVSDSVQMQEAMATDLEEIVHDHYHNIGFSMELDSDQTLVTKITDVRYEASSSMASLTATLREDGKGLDISIERLCRQIDLDFILEVELDTSVLGTQTVIPEGKIIADHNGDNGGLHAGLFDDKIIYDLELDYPAAVLDRTAHKITFENAEGVEPIVNKLAGETVSLPMGDHLTQNGNSFGGWIVSSGPNKGHRYDPGEIISMPDADIVLIPAFGHVEVELDIDYAKGEPVEYGNQMSEFSSALHFYNTVLDNGSTIDSDDIASIRIIDALPTYENTPSDTDEYKVLLYSVGGNSVDDVVYARHVGATPADKVVAYLTVNQSQKNKYDMVIAGPDGAKAPVDCSDLFSSFPYCTSIYLDALDTTGATDMSNMFGGNKALTTLEFGDGWDSSAVISMKEMFSGCNKLTNLDLSKFNTANVTDMSKMFYACYKLTSLDLRSFNTANVTNFSLMFASCSNLTVLNLSSFSTNKVENMSSMFSGCESLLSLDLGNFDTSSVTDMSQMFLGCKNLHTLNLSSFNTANVTDMSMMFAFCKALTTLDLSKFDTSKVTNMLMTFYKAGMTTLDLSSFDTSSVKDMSQMFIYCSNLVSVTFGNKWTNDQVTNMSKMFSYCTKLETLNWGGFSTPSVTDMSSMFSDCPSLPSLDLSHFNTSKVTNMSQMFISCQNLNTVTFGDTFDTSNVTDMSSMFAGCSKLGTLDVSEFNTFNVTNMHRMFDGCNELPALDLQSFDTTKVKIMSSMFADCGNLTSLTFGNSFNTANVTNMSHIFSGCSALPILDLSKFDTSKVTNMSQMFQSCKAITSLTFPDTFDTSKVTDMSEMFYNCANLEKITFGEKFVISNVKDISQMFSWCSKLKTVSNLGVGESNVLGNMNGFFSDLTSLESVTFRAPSTGAEFPKLSTLTSMFSGCTNLKTVDMSNWKLPNLTNTSSMFYNCSSLQNVNLSWFGIAATVGNYSIDSMFDGIPANATLETGGHSSVMLDAIKAAFEAAKGTPPNQIISQPNPDQESPTDTPDEPTPPTDMPDEPEIPTDTPDEPTPPTDMPDEPEIPTDTPDEPTPPTDMPDEPETPADTPDEPTSPTDTPDEPETPTDTPQESDPPTENSDEAGIPESPSAMSLNMTQAQTMPVQTAYNTDATDSSLYIYPTMVNPNDTITYKVTVKYVGNVGVKSGLITMNFPIPDGIIEFIGKGNPGDVDYEAPGWQIATTQIKDSGSSGGYLGGRIVKDPHFVTNADGTNVLQGVFEGLYAGTEITVSIKTTLQEKPRNEKGYIFWDGTAYATDNAGTATSRTVRLWNHFSEPPVDPTVDTYTLTYKFTGDVPSDAILPYVEQVEAGEHTSASEPTKQEGYTFDGWYFPDGKKKVKPGETFTMPPSDFVLTGRWKLADDKVQRITVMYEYDGNHIPEDAPKLVTEQTVKVGQTHYITKINQDANYHKFGGWKPTLSINNGEIPVAEQPDGTYQGVDPSNPDKVYTIDIAKNVLSTDQFKDKTNVIVTFRGPWIPYTGTIKFDPNGGTGSMDDMNNVTWDTESTLPENIFTYPDTNYKFVGWAKTPSGAIVKADQARADGLIDQDGEEVTLYAIWKRSTYRIGYDLNHVTSSSNQTTVALGENYSTILTAESGYEMSEVSVTMGGAVITSQVYDQSTGKISISNISGNIIISAEATSPHSEHTIKVSVTNGIATPSGDITVQDGQSQTISFMPNEGYVFESATVDGNATSLTDNTYTFRNVVSDHTISVVYQKDDSGDSGDGSGTKKYPIYVNYSGHGIATSDKQQAAAGETVTVNTNGTVMSITAVDKNGNELSITDQGNGSFTFTMPKSAATVTVEFEPLPDVANPDDTGVSGWLDTRNHFSYLDGYPDSTFRPGNNMTRAEVAQMFYNLLLNKDVAITVSFSDVKPESWYATAINTLASLDILEGVGKDQFAPERAITRAEFTAIAMRFAKLDKSGINIFSDVQESDWFYDYVVGSIQYGWITGYPDGTFRPNNTITRSEVTTITNRMLGRAADQTYVKNHTADLHLFADVTNTDWAYYQIVEATNSHEFEKVNGVEIWKKLK